MIRGAGILAVALLAVGGTAGTANAQTANEPKPLILQGLPCSQGSIAHEDVIAALVFGADVSLRGRALAAVANDTLGDRIGEWRNDPESPLLEPARTLDVAVDNLLDVEAGSSRYVVISPDRPAGDLGRLFLNRQAQAWIQFPCESARRDTASDWRDTLIVSSVGDSGKAKKFETRPFATLSWLDNRESGEETAEVDVYIGFSTPVWGPVSPSLAYQRRSGAKPVNDLTFALEGEVGFLSWSAGYETDDEFDSALYRAQFEFEPFADSDICAADFSRDDEYGPVSGGNCNFWLVGDYVDVDEIGDKTDLVDRREFSRLGGRVSASWWTRAGDTEAYWMLTGSYAFFETVGGDEADAAMARVSLNFLPSKYSAYSVGLTYENGDDLTSFTPIDQIKITLGFRR